MAVLQKGYIVPLLIDGGSFLSKIKHRLAIKGRGAVFQAIKQIIASRCKGMSYCNLKVAFLRFWISLNHSFWFKKLHLKWKILGYTCSNPLRFCTNSLKFKFKFGTLLHFYAFHSHIWHLLAGTEIQKCPNLDSNF